jgi:hypothetical protein
VRLFGLVRFRLDDHLQHPDPVIVKQATVQGRRHD